MKDVVFKKSFKIFKNSKIEKKIKNNSSETTNEPNSLKFKKKDEEKLI